jgi:hypothetical protein
MQHRGTLLLLLVALGAIGLGTIQHSFSPDILHTTRLLWMFALVVVPLTLGGAVLIGWTWATMACVIYGTIGLALDLATVISILGGRGGTNGTLALSGISGTVNFLLIVFGGRAFWSCLQGSPPPESRPPNPPSPFSSSAT